MDIPRMLTSAELAECRAILEQSLPDTATIQHRVSIPDGGGGETWMYPDAVTVACRLSPIAGGEQSGSDAGPKKIRDETTHILTLPHDTTISEVDRVIVGDQTYAVTYVKRRTSWEISRRVELRESV